MRYPVYTHTPRFTAGHTRPFSKARGNALEPAFFMSLPSSCALLAGGLNGALSTSKDTCLYGETFVLKVAGEHTANNPKVQTALLYYFGKLTVAPKDVPLQIYGIDTATITTVIIDPRTSKILDYLSSPAGELTSPVLH